MKASGARARALLEAPPSDLKAFLLFGTDAAEVDAARSRLASRLIANGGEGSEIISWDGAQARRDPEGLHAALRATGLFGGIPVVSLSSAGDGATDAVRRAVNDLPAAAGALIVSAGALPARSKLRKLFEETPACIAAAIEATPLSPQEIAELLRNGGAPEPTPEAMSALSEAAQGLEPSELRGALDLLCLYMLGSANRISPDDVSVCLPGALHGELNEAMDAVARRRPGEAAEAMARASIRGGSPVTAAMSLGRRMRDLHALCTAADGPAAAVGRLRPPVWGPRRDALVQAARGWSPALAERALTLVLDAELELRSSGGAPDFATIQRLAVRVAGLR